MTKVTKTSNTLPEVKTVKSKKTENKNEAPLTKQVGGSHYNNDKIVIQPIVYAELNQMSPLQAKVVKYITRYEFKNGEIDLDKAIHCIEMLKALKYGEKSLIKDTLKKIEDFLNNDKD